MIGNPSDTLNFLEKEQEQIYKAKYRELKRSFKSAVSKNEYLKDELVQQQRKLLVVEEDKHFLLERLLVHEQPPLSPPPARSTPGQDLSDGSDQETGGSTGTSTPKRSRLNVTSNHPGGVIFSSAFSKVRPLQNRKTKKGRGIGCKGSLKNNFSDFNLESPVGGFGLDSEDSSSLAGMGNMSSYLNHEEDSD